MFPGEDGSNFGRDMSVSQLVFLPPLASITSLYVLRNTQVSYFPIHNSCQSFYHSTYMVSPGCIKQWWYHCSTLFWMRWYKLSVDSKFWSQYGVCTYQRFIAGPRCALWGAALPQHQGNCHANTVTMVHISLKCSFEKCISYEDEFTYILIPTCISLSQNSHEGAEFTRGNGNKMVPLEKLMPIDMLIIQLRWIAAE